MRARINRQRGGRPPVRYRGHRRQVESPYRNVFPLSIGRAIITTGPGAAYTPTLLTDEYLDDNTWTYFPYTGSGAKDYLPWATLPSIDLQYYDGLIPPGSGETITIYLKNAIRYTFADRTLDSTCPAHGEQVASKWRDVHVDRAATSPAASHVDQSEVSEFRVRGEFRRWGGEGLGNSWIYRVQLLIDGSPVGDPVSVAETTQRTLPPVWSSGGSFDPSKHVTITLDSPIDLDGKTISFDTWLAVSIGEDTTPPPSIGHAARDYVFNATYQREGPNHFHNDAEAHLHLYGHMDWQAKTIATVPKTVDLTFYPSASDLEFGFWGYLDWNDYTTWTRSDAEGITTYEKILAQSGSSVTDFVRLRIDWRQEFPQVITEEKVNSSNVFRRYIPRTTDFQQNTVINPYPSALGVWNGSGSSDFWAHSQYTSPETYSYTHDWEQVDAVWGTPPGAVAGRKFTVSY
jgi:hypothetical protein